MIARVVTQKAVFLKASYQSLNSVYRGVIKLAFGTLWMILLTKVQVHLSFSPVPICMGPTGAIFIGALLGPRWGVGSVASFLTLGCMGIPVFAGVPFGPTWGYLVGYIASAWVMGHLVKRMVRVSTLKIMLAACIANLCLYVTGAIWLSLFTGWARVLQLGVYPFMAGMLVKNAGFSILFAKGKKAFSAK